MFKVGKSRRIRYRNGNGKWIKSKKSKKRKIKRMTSKKGNEKSKEK